MSWYPVPIPSQAGRSVLVTGANAGLGFFTSARLARAGAHVTLSGRSAERLAAAVAAIRARMPRADVDSLVIDTSSLESVRVGAERLLDRAPLDAVVLNAGMVHTPAARLESVDGNELVLATNVLGHFALLAHVLPHLATGARLVTIGSLSTRLSTFRVDDLQLQRSYDAWRAYAQSKIASTSIAFELDRRLRRAAVDGAEAVGAASAMPRVHSLVAHPGYSISGRTPRVPGVNEPTRLDRFADALQAPFAQGKHRGAEPIVHAVVADDVEGGQFWGPQYATKGPPRLAMPTRTSRDPRVGARVWAFAEQATGLVLDPARVGS
ncbi:NAD(P)-dependent dehydrogenase (short-subunit alcohol dehydrogenase family) [Agromyces flavus]|uniref:NAD(P)-dependent dehydrogenase (Short-subunit alcohol dehydrogenase family) n=1 Tax=Agromyces flavus TaxID=589382 RepID=A0A1H1ZM12_9MICO|nr:SDR family NAD(P)-dependent oxidoreductase [Agromyces flavus]MCP2367148.1 NAD(P)-dependent dehydrogenase (short-subunit alcohol dehydrogenase family) [Agromyces flavus]SDT34482.1 short chain dehydrogenase [Agromyces flavus]